MLSIFVTNHYRVLEAMYDSTVSIAGKAYCPLGQGEIAEKLSLSKTVVNKIFTDLRNDGYIRMITRGKWKLSGEANNLIKITKKL